MNMDTYRCLGCMSIIRSLDNICPFCGFSFESYDYQSKWIYPNTLINRKYILGKVLGEGGFGITYLGWDLNLQVRIAVKEYFPVGIVTRDVGGEQKNRIILPSGQNRIYYKEGLDKFVKEAQTLSKFYHLQGIVSVKDFFFENNTAYMVMDYIEGVTLSRHLKERGGLLKEEEMLRLMHPIMDSLKQVHKAGIIHRDISTDNIMVSNGSQMTLIDFGAARFLEYRQNRTLTIILKPGYAPVEQYRSHGNQGPWTDVYALCATMYRMLSGTIPPGAMDRLHKDTLIPLRKMGLKVSKRIDHAIVEKGMALNIEDRYQTMEQLLEALYGSNNDWKKGNKKNNVYLAVTAVLLLISGMIFWGINANRKEIQIDGLVDRTSQYISDDFSSKQRQISQEEVRIKQKQLEKDLGRISASAYHFVMIEDDGTVSGRGTNEYGQLDIELWKDIVYVSTGMLHTLGVKADGTVLATGDSADGKCAVGGWSNIVQTAAGDTMSLGLRADGTVVAVGNDQMGQCNTRDWDDIRIVAAGRNHSLGLKGDGTVVATGSNKFGQCNVEAWKDIVSLAANQDLSVALKEDGTVVLVGNTEGYDEVKNWKDVVAIDLSDGYLAGLLADGSLVTDGSIRYKMDEEKGGDIKAIAAGKGGLFGMRHDGTIVRTDFGAQDIAVEDVKNIKKVAAGETYIACLKNNGTVVLCGLLGIGNSMLDTSGWTDVTDISVSRSAVFGVRKDGTVLVSGDGYDEVSSWSDIMHIEAINGLAAGLKKDGTIITTGKKAENYKFEDWTNVTKLVSGKCSSMGDQNYVLLAGLKKNGTVLVTKAYNGYLDRTKQWRDVIDLAAGHDFLSGVRLDGTVMVEAQTSGGYESAYSWRGIVKTAAGASHTVGLREDGTVVAVGANSNGQCDVEEWTNILDIDTGPYYTVGITLDGTLVKAGKIPGEL